MILPIRSLVSILALATFANGAIVYRGYKAGSPEEMARHGLLPRQASASAAASSAAAMNDAPNDSPKFEFGTPDASYPGVVAQNKNGPTNPDKPSLHTAINQTSISRLASVNSVDDWCTFGPKDNSRELGDVEQETVAYCTKARNGARVIPDGTVTAAHFVKTPLYVQIMALGDFTKINFKPGDTGGELDPHGATEQGNPIGGNVTSNISGKDVFYEEWMNYVGHNIMCFRVCTAGSDQAPPTTECQHTLDEVGCMWVMPGDYTPDVFDTCEADPAYPPGVFVSGGSTSTFQQYGTGIWTSNGVQKTYTNGDKSAKTPTAAQSQPSSSNCSKVSSISNGIKEIIPTSSASSSGSGSGSGSKSGSGSGSGSGGSNGGFTLAPALAPVGAVFAAFVAGAFLL